MTFASFFSPHNAGEPRTRLAPALWLILGLGAFHLVFSAFVGLAGDEAYYWEWARRLDWGYYDHPPMIAWLIALGTQLAGLNEFGVRLFSVLLATASLALVGWLARDYAGREPSAAGVSPPSAALWAVLAVAATPLFSVGGFLATPDVPMVFFWLLSVTLTVRAARNPRVLHWFALGLALGLGMLSKYPFGILPLALLLAFLATRRGRALLRTPGPYLAAAVAVVILVPHLVWLARHDFAPILFQLGHGLGGVKIIVPGGAGWRSFAQFVVGQFGVLTPILFVLFLAALAGGVAALARRRGEDDEQTTLLTWLLVLPALLTLIVFAAASFTAKSQTNWPAAAWPTLAVPLGVMLARWTAVTGARRWLVYAAVGFAGAVSLYAHLEAAVPIVPYADSVFDKVQDKRGLTQWVEGLRKQRGEEGKAAMLFADNYRTAALLAFYLPDHPQTDSPFEFGSGSQYTLWREAGALPRPRTGFYVSRFENDPRIAQLLDAPQSLGECVEHRAGVATGKAYAWYGRLRAVAQPAVSGSR